MVDIPSHVFPPTPHSIVPMSTPLIWALNALLFLPPISAWTLVWTNGTNSTFVQQGTSSKVCTSIDNPKGKYFEWDGENSRVYVTLYGNGECSDPSGGWAQKWLAKNATDTIQSFKVDSMDSPSHSPSSSLLSGGAIAGIVVGVVATVVIFAAIIFFVVRRRRQSTYTRPEDVVPTAHASPTPLNLRETAGSKKKSAELASLDSTHAPIRHAELQTQGSTIVELDNSNRINELEAHSRSSIFP